jgi:hypothetical protein
MGLIEQEITELRAMAKAAMCEELSPEKASIQIGFFNQTAKRINQMIQIASLSLKEGKSNKIVRRLVDANIIGERQAIVIRDAVEEQVKCPEQGGKLIFREECLDFSGEENHIDACQHCHQFSITRKALLNK